MFETTILETTGNLQMFPFKGILCIYGQIISYLSVSWYGKILRELMVYGSFQIAITGDLYIYIYIYRYMCVWNVNSLERNDDKASAKSMGKEAEI